MASLAETIRSIATGKPLTEAAQPFMQANQPTVGDQGQTPVGGGMPGAGGPAPGEEPDLAGQQVVQAELILIADRAQKIAALAGSGAVMDPMLQTQITSIASDISQLYADLVLSATPDPNADPNAQQGQGQPLAAGSSQVNTNPKVAEDVITVEDVDIIASLMEISTDMARRYVNRSFTDLGDPDLSDRKAMNRKAGIKLAVDKAGGADKMWKNKSALGKKYGIPADEVRVKTTEEVDIFAQGYYEPPADVTEASKEVEAERNKNRYTSLDHKSAQDSDFLRNDHNGQKATPLVHKDGHKIGMNVRKGALYTHITNKGKETNFKSQQDMDSFLHKFHRSKMSEEEISELAEMFGIKGNPAINAAFDALKKGKPTAKPDTKMPGIRMPSDKIKEEDLNESGKHVFHVTPPRALDSYDKEVKNAEGTKKITVTANSRKEATDKAARYVAKTYGTDVNFKYVGMQEAVASAPTADAEDDANEHIIMQLHKSVTLGGKKIVRFTSGQKVKVDPKTAHAAIRKFSSLKPMEKAKAQEFLKASHNNLQQFVKEDISFIDEDEELQERVIKAEPHFIDRLEGSMNTSSGKEIEFENGQKVTIPPNIAKKIVEKFRSASAYDKQQLNKYVRSSYANLIRASRG